MRGTNRKARRDFINNPGMLGKVVNIYADEEKKKAIVYTIRTITATFAISLHDKYGWNSDSINELISHVSNQYACCCRGDDVTIEDIMQWAKEYGINLDGDKV